MAIPRTWLRRIALGTACTAVALGLGELGARALWREAPPAPAPVIPPGDWPTLQRLPDITRPHQRGIYHGAFLRTNSLGYRGPEWERAPAPGVARVILSGDSVAMGAGVGESFRYSDVTQRSLLSDPAFPPVEILNISVAGADITAAGTRLERAVARYGAHVTVYAFNLDDVRGPAFERIMSPAENEALRARVTGLETWSSLLARTLVPFVWEWTDKIRGRGHRRDDWNHAYLDDERSQTYVRAGLDFIARVNEGADTCGVVLTHPRLVDLGPTHPYRHIFEWVDDEATQRGFTVTHGLDALRWWRAGPLWQSLFDKHPNAAGHARLAVALETALRSLPESCWEGPAGRVPKPNVKLLRGPKQAATLQ